MSSLTNDSELKDLLSKSTELVTSLKSGSRSESLLDIAKELEIATDDYVLKKRNHHSLNDQMKKMKSRMDINKGLLRTAVTNVSQIRSKLSSGSEKPKALDFENMKGVNKNNLDVKLKEVNKKVHMVMKDIRCKAKGCSRLDRMLQEYDEIMKETGELFRSVPAVLKGREVPATINERSKQPVEGAEDRRAEDLLRSMSCMRITQDKGPELLPASRQIHDMGVGNWINYEGFDSSEELERFKALYMRMTGEDADNVRKECEDLSISSTEKDDMEFLEKVFQEYIQEQGS